MRLRYVAWFFLLGACAPSYQVLNYTVDTRPVYPIRQTPEKILLLNSCDVAAGKYRDNKEELFISLLDTVLNFSAAEILQRTGTPVKILPGLTQLKEDGDSSIYYLQQQNGATHAIVVTHYDTWFHQREVEVTKDSDGKKHREAYYDIVNKIQYRLYDNKELVKDLPYEISRQHSSRSVVISFLAAGPNVVSNKNDALQITKANVVKYLDQFFPGKAPRHRPVFSKKAFAGVGEALARNDYEAALVESMKLVHDADNLTAAKANYNCAVFMERKNQPDEARKYLVESRKRYFLRESYEMMNDLSIGEID